MPWPDFEVVVVDVIAAILVARNNDVIDVLDEHVMLGRCLSCFMLTSSVSDCLRIVNHRDIAAASDHASLDCMRMDRKRHIPRGHAFV